MSRPMAADMAAKAGRLAPGTRPRHVRPGQSLSRVLVATSHRLHYSCYWEDDHLEPGKHAQGNRRRGTASYAHPPSSYSAKCSSRGPFLCMMECIHVFDQIGGPWGPLVLGNRHFLLVREAKRQAFPPRRRLPFHSVPLKVLSVSSQTSHYILTPYVPGTTYTLGWHG